MGGWVGSRLVTQTKCLPSNWYAYFRQNRHLHLILQVSFMQCYFLNISNIRMTPQPVLKKCGDCLGSIYFLCSHNRTFGFSLLTSSYVWFCAIRRICDVWSSVARRTAEYSKGIIAGHVFGYDGEST